MLMKLDTRTLCLAYHNGMQMHSRIVYTPICFNKLSTKLGLNFHRYLWYWQRIRKQPLTSLRNVMMVASVKFLKLNHVCQIYRKRFLFCNLNFKQMTELHYNGIRIHFHTTNVLSSHNKAVILDPMAILFINNSIISFLLWSERIKHYGISLNR